MEMFLLRNCASCNILWTLTRGSCRGVCVPGKVRGPFRAVSKDIWWLLSNSGIEGMSKHTRRTKTAENKKRE